MPIKLWEHIRAYKIDTSIRTLLNIENIPPSLSLSLYVPSWNI